jgi:hypothetical protein
MHLFIMRCVREFYRTLVEHCTFGVETLMRYNNDMMFCGVSFCGRDVFQYFI